MPRGIARALLLCSLYSLLVTVNIKKTTPVRCPAGRGSNRVNRAQNSFHTRREGYGWRRPSRAVYGTDKGFNQAVKRNLARFPANFMVQLSLEETAPCGHNCDRIPPQPSVSTIRVYW